MQSLVRVIPDYRRNVSLSIKGINLKQPDYFESPRNTEEELLQIMNQKKFRSSKFGHSKVHLSIQNNAYNSAYKTRNFAKLNKQKLLYKRTSVQTKKEEQEQIARMTIQLKPIMPRNSSVNYTLSTSDLSNASKMFQIQPEFLAIQKSNGLEVKYKHQANYKYFVGPGNNDALINKILKEKLGWVKVHSPYIANFVWTQLKQKKIIEQLKTCRGPKKVMTDDCELYPLDKTSCKTLKFYNKLENNGELASKKKLFLNMLEFYQSKNLVPFEFIPETYYVKEGVQDQALTQLRKSPQRIWIVKPGEATNRGNGITVCDSYDKVSETIQKGKHKTYVVQKYIENPLLYKGRKFDIRCFMLVTSVNGNLQAYFYEEGYIRTACSEFNLNNVTDKYVHLTNDAVQKKSPNYGKHELGNKLSFEEFQVFVQENHNQDFLGVIYPKIQNLVKDTIEATQRKLDPKMRLNGFEIFGYDFMLDTELKPWLIEVNTNPCLALSSPYLATLIPNMLHDAFRIALDPYFIPCSQYSFPLQNGFRLVFNRACEPN